MKSILCHAHDILPRFKVCNTQLASFRGALLQFAVEEYFDFIFAGKDQQRANILVRLQKSAERRRRPKFDVHRMVIASLRD